MKITTIFIVLLLSFAAHAADKDIYKPASQQKLQEVEHQLIKSGISKDYAHETVQAMVQGRFTTQQMERASQQMAFADPLGISRRALGDKIHEGVIKNIPPENIVTALVKVRNRFELAENFVTDLGYPGNALLARHYVDCLAAGLTVKDAHQLSVALQARIRHQSNKNRFRLSNEAMLTARDMVRQNISSHTTVGVLSSALQQGYSGEDMQRVRNRIGKMSGNLERGALSIGAAIDQGAKAGEVESIGNKGGISGGSGNSGNSNGSSGGGSSGGSGAGSSGGGSSGGSGNSGAGSSGGGGNGGSGGGSGGEGGGSGGRGK